MQEELELISNQLRRQAYVRSTDYKHQILQFTHEPINRKQCQEMHKQLKEKVQICKKIVDQNKNFDQVAKNYAQAYEQYSLMSLKNENQQKQMCSNIQNMHQMADILMHPPIFSNQLFLYSRNAQAGQNKDQANKTIEAYESAYGLGDRFERSKAQRVIKEAKEYLHRG